MGDTSLRPRITQAEAEQLISINHGLCVIKDLQGLYVDLTTNAIDLIASSKFRSRKEAIGRSEYDLMVNENAVRLYHSHDRSAMSGTPWLGLEPCWWKGVPSYGTMTKYGIEDKKGNIIGCFFQGMVLENRMLSHHLQELSAHQLHLNAHQSCFFELEFAPQHSTYLLTPREAECLFYTIHGKTAKAIGALLGISSKTVEFHLINLKSIFKCYSKSELISKAIDQGFLHKIPPSVLKIASNLAANQA